MDGVRRMGMTRAVVKIGGTRYDTDTLPFVDNYMRPIFDYRVLITHIKGDSYE